MNQDHIKQVQQWLDKNVKVFATPDSVTLSAFRVESGRYSGSFDVCLDGVRVPERFRFGLGSNGKPEVYFPMFHSPLGAPASYAAVELTGETGKAIKDVLTSTLPKMKPLGLNPETGELVLHTTHSESDRILDMAHYTGTMERISHKDFSVSCRVNCAQRGTQTDSPASGGPVA